MSNGERGGNIFSEIGTKACRWGSPGALGERFCVAFLGPRTDSCPRTLALTVLETRNLEWRSQQSHTPSESPGKGPCMPILAAGACQQPLVFPGLWQHRSQFLPPPSHGWHPSVCICVSKWLFYENAAIGSGTPSSQRIYTYRNSVSK